MDPATILSELRRMTEEEIRLCAGTMDDGTKVFFPSGSPEYRDAYFPFDFFLMLECAPEMFDFDEVKPGVEMVFGLTREDGWPIDRVLPNGVDVQFAAGPYGHPIGRESLSCPTALIRALYRMVGGLDAAQGEAFYRRWADTARRALAALPRDADGLVYNDPADPHTPFGFTDITGKTGGQLLDSLELWRAYRSMVRLQDKYGDDSAPYREEMTRIEAAVPRAFLRPDGMLNAATIDCRQTDIWSSALAVAIGFPLPGGVAERIRGWISTHVHGISRHGHFRHLPEGEYWQKLTNPCEKGEYMNGAYWAVASGWIAEAVYAAHPTLALRILEEACREFREGGVWECINGAYKKGAHYPSSIVGVYAAAKHLIGGEPSVYTLEI